MRNDEILIFAEQIQIPHFALRIPHSHMPDWKKHVRDHLPPLQLGGEREVEIVEEFALHLEAVYDRSLMSGSTEKEAFQKAIAQIEDWRHLECEVNRAESPAAGVWSNRRSDFEYQIDETSMKKGKARFEMA